MKNLRLAALLLAGTFAFTGCSSTKSAKKTETIPSPNGEMTDAEGAGKEGSVTEANIRGSEFGATAGLATIFFEYDKSTLSDEARTTLSKNAEFLKKNADFDILVEGHCDERGTIEYNLALGQKRAQAVKDYYARLGLPGRKLGTISYGKEKPGCTEATEECWGKNRRGETKVRARVSSSQKSKPLGTKPEPK